VELAQFEVVFVVVAGITLHLTLLIREITIVIALRLRVVLFVLGFGGPVVLRCLLFAVLLTFLLKVLAHV